MKTLQFINWLQGLLSFLLMFYSIYQLVIWAFAYSKETKKNKCINKKHKFMAIVSARNEEKVIANLIESLKKQNYPKDLLDIYVIADNCTDNTAKNAKNAGAIVYERFNECKKSKGYALEWFFDIVLKEFPDKYDAFCIFDADNIVDLNFMEKMNDKLCEGETIVQGYRDIKNAGDNWISANYALYYWTMNRCYHYARHKLGLAPMINGTGFMVSMSVLKEENGWHTETLTEDTEFSIKSVVKGRKIAWANEAIIYDEQPTLLSQAWNQRLRWGVGNIQCLKKCMPEVMSAKQITPALIDTFIYLMSMPIIIISIIATLLSVIQIWALPLKQSTILISEKIEFFIVFISLSIIQAFSIVLLEKKDLKIVWKGIITYPIFLFLCFVINVAAFFNTNMTWRPIKHVRTVNINELKQK